MFDSVTRISELRALLTQAKQEREQLASALASLAIKKRVIDDTVETLARTQESTRAVSETLERVTARLDTMEARTATLPDVSERIAQLDRSLKESEQTAARLMGPEGDLARHQAAIARATADDAQARVNLDAIRKERAILDEVRDQLGEAITDVREATERSTVVKAEFDQYRTLSTQLGHELAEMRDTSRDAREQTQRALEAAKETDVRIEALKNVDEVARTAKERVAALNLVVEHVTQKTKSIEAQKETVERAIVEASRLKDLVWNMDSQVAKLHDGMRQLTQAEDLVDRLGKAGREAAVLLERGTKARDAFQQDLARIDHDRIALTEFIRAYQERVDGERRQLDAVDQRVSVVQGSLTALEKATDTLMARDRTVAAVGQQISEMERQAGVLGTSVADLSQKQAALDALRDELGEVDDLSRRTALQFDNLKTLREDLVSLTHQMDTFHQAHVEAVRLRDTLDVNRASFSSFLDRMDAFRISMPELDSRLDAVAAKLSVVDDGTRKASDLVALTDNLDRQLVRVIDNQKLVEQVETRINALHGLATDVGQKVDEQLARRTDIDGLKNACDNVTIQVSDVRQKIEAVSAVQATLVPLTVAVDTLKNDVERTHARFEELRQDEATLTAQETKLAEILLASRTVADEAGATMKQGQALFEELRRSTAVKDELMGELAAVQARQRDVSAQASNSEDQLKRLEAALRQIEQRRSQLTFIDKTIEGFDARLGTLRQAAEDVDRKIDAVGARETVIDAVRREVDGVRELSAQSKADLQSLSDRRAEIATLKKQVDTILARAAQTQDQLGRVETRRRDVDEVFERTNLIVNMLEDVRLNLELVNEQKAVVDHVARDMARFTGVIEDAQRTFRSLQAERELAERIERSIKTLRARGGATDDDKSKTA